MELERQRSDLLLKVLLFLLKYDVCRMLDFFLQGPLGLSTTINLGSGQTKHRKETECPLQGYSLGHPIVNY